MLDVDATELLHRLQTRKHFFPPNLLQDQLSTLEPLQRDELGISVDASFPEHEVIDEIISKMSDLSQVLKHE